MNYVNYLDTELGCIEIVADESALHSVQFVEKPSSKTKLNDVVSRAKQQLSEYFQGVRKVFDLPVKPNGTAFQQQVWQQLELITYGDTASYQDIADRIGNTKAVRAVGAANGKNPIAIIVPCHRVIGKNGTLTGYAGGLHRKQWLLNLEGR